MLTNATVAPTRTVVAESLSARIRAAIAASLFAGRGFMRSAAYTRTTGFGIVERANQRGEDSRIIREIGQIAERVGAHQGAFGRLVENCRAVAGWFRDCRRGRLRTRQPVG